MLSISTSTGIDVLQTQIISFIIIFKQETAVKERKTVKHRDECVDLGNTLQVDIGKDHIKLLVAQMLKGFKEGRQIKNIFDDDDSGVEHRIDMYGEVLSVKRISV